MERDKLAAMRRLLTARQAEVVELAATLAAAFAERAGDHDRDNTFPAENWPAMAEAGYLGLAVPRELGGFDADVPSSCSPRSGSPAAAPQPRSRSTCT